MMAQQLISPLRYPGGKNNLTTYIQKLLEVNGLINCTFYEPYVGGAAVSLFLLSHNLVKKVVWVERDPLIYSFWHCVIKKSDELCKLINTLDITIDTWHQFQKYRKCDNINDYSILELGLAGLFFNRTNFSGVLKANPIGGLGQKSSYAIDCRFKKERLITLIKNINAFHGKIEVHFTDALEFLNQHKGKISRQNSFLYIDPPYYKQGQNLYRYFYTDSDHTKLSEHLKKQISPWLISYDDHEFIRNLYQSTCMHPIYMDYSIRSQRKAEELMISNLIIPPEFIELFSVG